MKKSQVLPVLFFFLLILSAVLFIYVIIRSQLLPGRMVLIIAVIFLLTFLLLGFLVFKSKKKFFAVFGTILSLLLAAAVFAGSFYVVRAVRTAHNITTTKIEVSSVCVYMLADETDSSVSLTRELRYGILEVQDRENTDAAIKSLEEELGGSIRILTYSGPSELFAALENHEVDAIIINSAFLDLLDDREGQENSSSKLREVHKTQVEKEVVEQTKPSNSGAIFPFIGMNENTEPASSENRTFALYISGIDSRTGLVEKSRSDVNILLIVNPDTHQVLLINTPRDYYVPLSISNGIRDKLTHAGIYGVQVSMDTLEMLYDIDLDYYFRVNFEGFIDIVEAMGGVTVNVEKSFSTTEYSFEAGPNELNGYKALSFVRNRFGIGDQQRGLNQVAFIKGVIKKATSTDMLLHFSSIMSSVEGSFETSMPYDTISELVREQIDTGAEWNVVSYAVSGTGASRTTYSMSDYLYVMIPDESTVETAKDLIRQVYDGKVISAPLTD